MKHHAMNLRLCAFLCALVLFLYAPAGAQDDTSADSSPPPLGVSAQLQGLLGGVLKPASGASTIPAPTTFISTGKPLYVNEMLSRLTLPDDQIQQFRKYAVNVIGVIQGFYKENGFAENDVSVALGALLGVCYEMEQGTFKLNETDKAQQARTAKRMQAAVRQMQRALGGTPAFTSLSEESKQRAYEACTFTLGHLAVTWQQAGQDAAKRNVIRQKARQQLIDVFRFDPDGIARNAAGEFVPKVKTGGEAGQAVPKAEPVPEPPATDAAHNVGNGNANQEAAPQDQAVSQSPAANAAAPENWKMQTLSGGVIVLTPPDLKPGVTYSVAVFPLRPMGNKAIDAWLADAIPNDPLKPGKASDNPTLQSPNANAAHGVVTYKLPDGTTLIALYSALSVDQQTARLTRLLATTDSSLLDRYKDATGKITRALLAADKKAAIDAGRGVDTEKVPDTPEGMTPGGSLTPGIYSGTQTLGEEARSRYRVYLYPNGQYRIYNRSGKQLNSSVRLDYTYDHRTGKLDMADGFQHDMFNDAYDPNRSLCLYGRDAEGKPCIYARMSRGFSYLTAVLRYEGPLDKPSPATEKAAEIEAARFKLIVPPGQGLKPSEIAGILHNSTLNSFYNGSGMSVSSTHDLYLLLKDGTIYNGLPVAPDELDVPRSRRQEPAKWGRWKRDGDTYSAAWPDAPNQFRPLPDAPTQFRPLPGALMVAAPKGTLLNGRYGTGTASGTAGGGSYRLWGVTFTPEGRFLKDNRGGYGSSAMATDSGTPSINSTYDDEGSHTSATGPNFAVGTGKKNTPGADRSGTYSLGGYTLILRYDDGRIVRLPFFFEDADRDGIWFEGAFLMRDKDGKN